LSTSSTATATANSAAAHTTAYDDANINTQVKLSYNVIAKPKHQLTTLISDEIDTIQNKSNLIFKRPLERGYTTDLGTQFQIWDYILTNENLECRHSFSNGGVRGGVLQQQQQQKSAGSGAGGGTGTGGSTANSVGGAGGGTGGGTSSGRVTPVPGSSIYTHTAAVFCLHQPFTPRNILEKEDEIWFRDFGFGRVQRRLGACCSAFRYLQLVSFSRTSAHANTSTNASTIVSTNTESLDQQQKQQQLSDDGTRCCCVIDSGFSLTHIVPTVDARAISKAIRRINIGGKLLTNLLKEILSYRQFHMMEEFYNVNEAKEALCYVSTQFENELRHGRDESRAGCRLFDREFVLPDYVKSFQGSVRLPQRLKMLLSIMNKEERDYMKKTALALALPLSSPQSEHELQKDEASSNLNEMDDNSMDVDVEVDNKDIDKKDDDKYNNTNGEEDSNENDDGNDSDNETMEQKRQRILQQRQEEQQRREMEEAERQALLLSVERFTVPELLFRPSDIGMRQLGLAEAIVQSIEACDPVYRAAMYHNIVLTGGNMKIPNLKDRLEKELRSIAPSEYTIRVYLPDDPVSFAFMGAQDMVKTDAFMGGLDRAEWEALKQSGKTGDVWNSKRAGNDDLFNANSNNGFVVI